MTQNPTDDTKENPSHFRETWPYFWINRANSFYTRALEKRLKPMGVDAPRWRVLITLYQQDYMSVSEIAEFSTVKLNTATKIVQRMIAEGLVKTRVRPTDGRVTEVCLTEQGDALRAKALVEVSRIRDESFYNISPAELETLNGILRKVSADLAKMI
ncbi:MarR family winged helix-turn-helix transcriptional regulator [Celeribacter litoreus]|uniref:MarR family winged helix-turn-helix transcriptional regulator n=1 Tax=Celeribacter litoreus TaxID=2876714 RepID=UPI001CCEED04|nr:MarR family winged helix-turn-helix transcriptional regulator [Celeribacter litoreus]MCA0043938.1 MarR family winged helix-turn-helix transcriptional regulator [Celeribacter litoreus]